MGWLTIPKVIKAIAPGAKTGAKSVNYWKNKASAARIKNMSFNIKQTAKKLGDTMDKLGKK